jgi:transcriptional regulator with GAF, ATPase, and Fis domain
MKFTYIAVNLIDQNQERLLTPRASGLAQGLQGMERPLALVQNDILMDVARRRKAEIIDGWDPRFDREIYEREGHAALVRAYIPLTMRDQAVGVLEVGYRRGERVPITEEELRLLDSLADQASIAVQNTRLYEQTQARVRRERILREVTARVRSSTDPAVVMRTLARELGTALGRRAFVRLVSPPEGDAEPFSPAPGNGDRREAEGGQ